MAEKFKTVTVDITNRHIEYLLDNRIYTSLDEKEKSWLRPGIKIKFDSPVEVEPYSSQRVGNNFCCIRSFSYTRSSFHSSQVIGRYCAIAPSVSVLGLNHPMDRLSMCGFDYSDRAIFAQPQVDFKKQIKRYPLAKRQRVLPVIENDVWIGQGATLAQGIRIGNGAVVAARSVVTKSVPDYAVVAGNPARIKKYRFNEKTILQLVASEWWKYSFVDFGSFNTVCVEEFLSQFEAAASARTISPYNPARIRLDIELPAV